MTYREITVGLDQDIYDWLEAQIRSRVFHNRRHGIEFALRRLKSQWEGQEKMQKRGGEKDVH